VAKSTESEGKCDLCGATFSKRRMLNHLAECAYPAGKNIAAVAQIRVDVPRSPYWMDLDIKLNAPISDLDHVLRSVWLECCDHLSSFEVDGVSYVAEMDGSLRITPPNRSMRTRASWVLPPVGGEFAHEYDFGSTTRLRLKVVAHRLAPSRVESVRVLAQNDDPVWTCNECGVVATSLCRECSDQGDAFFCEAHAESHDCGVDMMLPVVNSPRMGVCGYIG